MTTVLQLIHIILIHVGLSYLAMYLFIASVMDCIGNSTLNRFRKDLLDLLGDDGGITAVLCVCLGGRLVSLAAGRMNLKL